jgi:hypothetical protein
MDPMSWRHAHRSLACTAKRNCSSVPVSMAKGNRVTDLTTGSGSEAPRGHWLSDDK